MRPQLPPLKELQGVASIVVHERLGSGGFGAVVSGTLIFDSGCSWRTALKVMSFNISSLTLPNIHNEVVLADLMGQHPSIVSTAFWLVVGDSKSSCVLADTLDACLLTPRGEHEVLLVLALSREMDMDLHTFLQCALLNPMAPDNILVSVGCESAGGTGTGDRAGRGRLGS